jgi:hypothetical protein
MREDSIEKLYYLYRILTLHYNKAINNSSDLLDYVYNMDIHSLKTMYRAYIWEDYLFIDDEMFECFVEKMKLNPIFNDVSEFDYLSEIDSQNLQNITEGVLVEREQMVHEDIIPDYALEYMLATKAVSLYLFNDEYRPELIKRLRNRKIIKFLY